MNSFGMKVIPVSCEHSLRVTNTGQKSFHARVEAQLFRGLRRSGEEGGPKRSLNQNIRGVHEKDSHHESRGRRNAMLIAVKATRKKAQIYVTLMVISILGASTSIII